jgi:hypothetical protein
MCCCDGCLPFTANVFQVPLEALLVVQARFWRAIWCKGAGQGVQFLRLRITLLATEVAQTFHTVQALDASNSCHPVLV